jgi:hypothetical protein
MNILKHMEAVFVATVALAVSSSYLVDTLPQAHAKPVVSASAIPVVVVSAKRMSAQEKQQSLQAEAGQPASRI